MTPRPWAAVSGTPRSEHGRSCLLHQHKLHGVRTSINETFDGRISKGRIFTVSRRLDGPRGVFMGVVAVALSSAYLGKFYREVSHAGELTGGLAHDFNNLLHVVSTNAAILSLLPHDADKRPHLSAITRTVASGVALTRHLLAFARKQPLAFVRIRTAAAVRENCEMARHLLPKTIELVCDVEPDVHDIMADAAELELAIINLTVNARDAMPAGGTITVCARNVAAGGATANQLPDVTRDYVAISVADTGTGIPEAMLARVFEPFFTTKKEKGTGLGLSRVYGYVTQLGGHVTATNRASGGALITLYLPRMESATSADAQTIETRSAASVRAEADL